MKYWSAGDVDSSIYDAFFDARKISEEKINLLLENKNYTEDINTLDVIYVIIRDEGKENIRYKSKSKELDLKIVIDYDTFGKASPNNQIEILINGLIRSLEKFISIKKIKNFDIVTFKNDLDNINKT